MFEKSACKSSALKQSRFWVQEKAASFVTTLPDEATMDSQDATNRGGHPPDPIRHR